jgi:hypothetical protein
MLSTRLKMNDDLPLTELEEDVQSALKGWYQASPPVSPLAYLHLFQQALLAGGGNIRQTTNQLLLEALERLAEDYPIEAALLRRRFLDRLGMRVVANQLNMGHATAYRRLPGAIHQLALVLQEQEARAREAYQAEQVGGGLDNRRYSIHRLTETFLLHEALKWRPGTELPGS